MLPYSNVSTVYHGTNLFSANLIQYYGIMLDAQREYTDFGKAFYVTFNPNQAKKWAYAKAKNPHFSPLILTKLNMSKEQYLNHPDRKIPAYVAFNIDLGCLFSLHGLVFPMPDDLPCPYYKKAWETLVQNCRLGINHNYDFVYGPVGGRHQDDTFKVVSSKLKDQLSLNSLNAIRCLSNLKVIPLISENKPSIKPTKVQTYINMENPINTYMCAPHLQSCFLYRNQILWYQNYKMHLMSKYSRFNNFFTC